MKKVAGRAQQGQGEILVIQLSCLLFKKEKAFMQYSDNTDIGHVNNLNGGRKTKQ